MCCVYIVVDLCFNSEESVRGFALFVCVCVCFNNIIYMYVYSLIFNAYRFVYIVVI